VSDHPVEPSFVSRSHAFTLVAACFAVVALLGAGVLIRFAPQMDLDGVVSEAVYAGDDRAASLDGLLEVLTAPGGTVFRVAVFLPVVVLLLVRRALRTAAWVAVPVLTVGLVNTLLKESFGRVRPDFDEGGARLDSLSYPSGHSSGIATLVTVGLLLLVPLVTSRVLRHVVVVLGLVLVVLVGLTRMWLGVHYLSDVVGGWSLGLGWSLLVVTLLGGLPGHRAALPAPERAAAP
jgi:membrane-associated phospholipid phosphatase